ncbi:MAG TPA: MATE family efflux transporter [Rhodocyclaceae bacterium]|nr:MATE family efflux transporter [Rhodocyclaceae bacterium]
MQPLPIRPILQLAWPVLVAQLAAMGMTVADTVMTGRYATDDLAAVAVGGGLYISIVFALAGIIHSIAPIVAHHHGASRREAIGPAFQQGVWLALMLSLPGALLLAFPDPLLGLSRLTPSVEAKTRAYMATAAWAIPAVMLYRAFHSFNNALGRPRPMMVIALLGTVLHVPLAYALINGRAGLPELGAVGCAASTAAVSWFGLSCAVGYLGLRRSYRQYRLFSRWRRPQPRAFAEMLRLGAPMGFSNFVEITSFTLIALFVARLGPEVVAGHRVVANINAVLYMLPLSIASATLVLTGQALGAGERARARATAGAGLALGCALAVIFGAALWLAAQPLIFLYTTDTAVRAVALGLIGYVSVFLLFDAWHTIGSFTLRGYKVTLAPMLIHVVCFWGLGLAGGYRLAFHGLAIGPANVAPMGAAGFWLMAIIATVVAGALIGAMLWSVSRRDRPHHGAV